MTSKTIATLAWFMPRAIRIDTSSFADLTNIPEKELRDVMHYLECYKDLQFGWNFANIMAKEGMHFPAILEGDDLWVWRAYNYLNGNPDPIIRAALQLTLDKFENTRHQIHALLVHRSSSIHYVSKQLAIPIDIIKAYEKLFFNVLDRKFDHKFISDVIYPNTRLVEAYEGYLDTTGLGTILLRAGYNNGPEDVLYCAGLSSDNPFALLTESQGATKLSSMIMADGAILARNGWGGQRRHAVQVQNARQIIQATKIGGADSIDAGAEFNTIGEAIFDDLKMIQHETIMSLAEAYEVDKMPTV